MLPTARTPNEPMGLGDTADYDPRQFFEMAYQVASKASSDARTQRETYIVGCGRCPAFASFAVRTKRIFAHGHVRFTPKQTGAAHKLMSALGQKRT